MRDFLVVGGREEVPSCDVCAVINAFTAYLLFSTVHTAENFTIQWDRVHNNAHLDAGTFTFQLTLFRNGTIVFAYREVRVQICMFVHVCVRLCISLSI